MLNTLDYLAQLVMTPALATADILNDEDRAKYGRIAFWLSVVISTVGSFLLNPELGFDPLTFVSTVLITGFILYVGIWISTWIMYATLRIIRARTESVHVQTAMIAAYFTRLLARKPSTKVKGFLARSLVKVKETPLFFWPLLRLARPLYRGIPATFPR